MIPEEVVIIAEMIDPIRPDRYFEQAWEIYNWLHDHYGKKYEGTGV